MNLTQVIEQANNISDENMAITEAAGFLNDAIAKINAECLTNFPFFDTTKSSEEYVGFPETWQRTLLVPFVVGRIKQKDSSQFEYNDAYSEFLSNLILFKSSYKVPDEYKETNFATWKQDDFSSNPWRW